MTTFHINGRAVTVDAEEDTPLLWVIRDVIGLTGTKFGCGIGMCGACTVHVGGRPTRSCITPLASVAGGHPLLEDLDLVEFVLRLPPELSLDPVLTRPLARDALAGLLPDDVRLRPDKVDFTPLVVAALGGPDRALAEALLLPGHLEVEAYVRPASLVRLLDTPPERRSAEWARVTSRLATTEAWLRSQADPGLSRRLLEEHSAG